jgi:hypothetical protein
VQASGRSQLPKSFLRRASSGSISGKASLKKLAYVSLGESGGRLHIENRESADHTQIIIHTATADHLPSVEAVLDGVRQRATKGLSTIFIHTSGSSVLDGGSVGDFEGNKIYSDTDPNAINAVPDDAFHRTIDLAIVKASQDLGDKAKLAIMIPPEIYGFNPRHRRLSIQIPTIARFALKHGYAGHVGKGLSVWSQVHVLDLARAYIVLLHHIESAEASTLVQNPYFFCENGKEISWKEVAEEVGQALYAKGLIKDATPKELKKEVWDDLFGEYTPAVMGLNSRSRAVRLRELGWKSQEKGTWESFNEDELPEILAEKESVLSVPKRRRLCFANLHSIGTMSRYTGIH